MNSIALQDTEQEERGIEVIEGDGRVQLTSSLFHKPRHPGMQCLYSIVQVTAVFSGTAQVVSRGERAELGLAFSLP